MSKIKYVTPSGLAHYDEKIKKVITEIETGSDSKVTQTPTTSNEEYSLLLSPSGQTEETNTTSYFNSDVVLNPSTKTISANIDGNAKTATTATSADSATKLATSRTVRTNLSSTSTASFDGSANIEPGVTGTLPVANGGTGKTTLGDSANALINGLSTGSDAPKDNDYYISQYAGGGTTTTTFHRRPVSALWEYIKGKISSVLGLTASSYSGNSATATKLNTNAGSATQPTYFAGGIPKACTYSLNKTVPANAVFTDTDTKVTNTLATTTKAYVTGTTSASTNTGTQVFDTGVYLDTTSGQLTATTFKGSLNGNAATATSASNIANNLTTTASGYSLDARQGKALGDVLFQSTSGKFITSSRGLKIYWGTTSAIGRSNHNYTISFSTPFTSTNYAVICTHNGADTYYASSEAVVSSKTVNSCVISSYCVEGVAAMDGDFKYDYLIIGY